MYQGVTQAEWLSDIRRRGEQLNEEASIKAKARNDAIIAERAQSITGNKKIIQDYKDAIFFKKKELDRLIERGDTFNASLIAEDLEILKKELWFKERMLILK